MPPTLQRPRLTRLHETLQSQIEAKSLPGLVALVSHQDEVHVETLGTLSFDSPTLMQRNTLFRIASLSKLITAAAAMILVEECKLRLDDSIEPWLPELANRRVLKSLSVDPENLAPEETVPAVRAITVRDLLTYRMGTGSIMAAPGTYPIQKLIRKYKIGGDGPPLPAQAPTMDEWLSRLGSLPLIAQPGEHWMYHISGDVLGALTARVTGQSLGAFLEQRILGPLGMKDSSFRVPPEKLDRLASVYTRNPTNQLYLFDGPSKSSWASEPPFESAGGGLVSTLDDYFAFSQMMLNKGRYGSEQILSRASVELMTSDHVTPAQRAGAEIFFGDHSSWGFGMAIDLTRKEIYHNPGRFGWTGGLGTTAYIDPKESMIGILFTQRMMESPEPPRIFTDFWTLAYQAVR